MTVFKFMKLGHARYGIYKLGTGLDYWTSGYCVAVWDFETLGM